MEGIKLKKQKVSHSKEGIDITKCIICQDVADNNTTSTTNGCARLYEAAKIRNDSVFDRLKSIDNDSHFCYHVNNKCYKTYTLQSTLDTLLESKANAEVPVSEQQRVTRSQCSPRNPAGNTDANYKRICVVCGCVKKDGTKDKYRISEKERASKFLKAAIYFQDATYTRTSDLGDETSVFGADLFCHKKCINAYCKTYDRSLSESKEPHPKVLIFEKVISDVSAKLVDGTGFTLTDIAAACNEVNRDSSCHFTNRDVKLLLTNKFGDRITFMGSRQANKPTLFYLDNVSEADMAEMISCSDPIKEVAKALRETILHQDFDLQDRFCDANDLRKAMNSITIPDDVSLFLSTLLNVESSDILQGEEDNEDTESEAESHTLTSKERKLLSLYQIMYYIIHNGKKRTPLHIMNAESIHTACRSRTLITKMNRYGLAVSYNEICRYEDDMASYLVESAKERVPLPSHFDPSSTTMGAFDNFDHEEATLSGIGGTHDTVMILMQDKPSDTFAKPNISDTDVVHGKSKLKDELPCQKQIEYIKAAKKPNLAHNYTVSTEFYSMDPEEHASIKVKDIGWSLTRLDLSDLTHGKIQAECANQKMPSWAAFNALVTDENLPLKIIGFLPVIPHPVTSYSTVYTALLNFQDVLSQLTQSKMAISCDEGVYHIAREIMMWNANEFSNLVICLGSFHLIKVVMGCIGKFIDGCGIEAVLIEKEIFGENVVKAVLNG